MEKTIDDEKQFSVGFPALQQNGTGSAS